MYVSGKVKLTLLQCIICRTAVCVCDFERICDEAQIYSKSHFAGHWDCVHLYCLHNYTPVAMVVHVDYILYSALFWTLQVSLGHSLTPD